MVRSVGKRVNCGNRYVIDSPTGPGRCAVQYTSARLASNHPALDDNARYDMGGDGNARYDMGVYNPARYGDVDRRLVIGLAHAILVPLRGLVDSAKFCPASSEPGGLAKEFPSPAPADRESIVFQKTSWPSSIHEPSTNLPPSPFMAIFPTLRGRKNSPIVGAHQPGRSPSGGKYGRESAGGSGEGSEGGVGQDGSAGGGAGARKSGGDQPNIPDLRATGPSCTPDREGQMTPVAKPTPTLAGATKHAIVKERGRQLAGQLQAGVPGRSPPPPHGKPPLALPKGKKR